MGENFSIHNPNPKMKKRKEKKKTVRVVQTSRVARED